MLLYEEYQPLRISSDWKVERSLFFAVDPSEDTMSYFTKYLLYLSSDSRNQYIQLSWFPEDDPNGEYILEVFHIKHRYDNYHKKVLPQVDYTNSHLVFKSKKRLEIVAKLEHLMFFLDYYKEPTIFKSEGIVDEEMDALRIELSNGYSESIAKKICESNHHDLQRLLIDTEEVTKEILLILQESGADKKIKNIAKSKLTQKKYTK